MQGLYALKPWYAERLTVPRATLARRGVHPSTVSMAGVAAACGAAAALALLPSGVAAAAAVSALLAARLACANLDGGLAHATGRTTRRGALTNEISDRLADLVVLAALLAHTRAGLVALAALASTLPSWVALAVAAAGGTRRQGGPVGKVERCLVVAGTAAVGHATLAAGVLICGGVITALVRAVAGYRDLAGVA